MQMRTNWDMMVSGKELAAEKNNRKKVFISEKIVIALFMVAGGKDTGKTIKYKTDSRH